MPRFVILRHETPPHSPRPAHFDLMLEVEGALWTWALPEEPAPGRKLAATRLTDHRLAYLNYEGEISGDRGYITRWDDGAYELLPRQAAPAVTKRSADEELLVRLVGSKIAGEVFLTRRGETADQWWFLWKGN
jgi:hypothetical protein